MAKYDNVEQEKSQNKIKIPFTLISKYGYLSINI